MIAVLAIAIIFVGTMALMYCEEGHPAAQTRHGWLGLAFEAVSAFGTVGLSTGVTPLLTAGGKLVIIALMFVGRVGPLMLAVHLTRPTVQWRVRYPTEELSLG